MCPFLHLLQHIPDFIEIDSTIDNQFVNDTLCSFDPLIVKSHVMPVNPIAALDPFKMKNSNDEAITILTNISTMRGSNAMFALKKSRVYFLLTARAVRPFKKSTRNFI